LFPQYADAYLWLRNNTPLKSVIWSWWDYGLPISAIGERTVYIDGMHFGCGKSYCIAKSMCTLNEEEFRKIILRVSSLGNQCGIENEHLSYSFASNPIYLLYSFDLMRKTKRFFYLSGLGKSISEPIWFFSLGRCASDKGKILCKKGAIDMATFDVTAVINSKKSKLVAKRFVFIQLDGDRVKNIREVNIRDKGLTIEIFDARGFKFAVAMSEPVYNSMLNKMFLLGDYDHRYFKLVYSDFPLVRIYKVNKEIGSE
jgi:dolichyl-diphosphooligosaccharide--protein glycosyltransferase